jgi:hypothetical protein
MRRYLRRRMQRMADGLAFHAESWPSQFPDQPTS